MKDTYITYILLIVAVLSITYVVSLKTKEGMENRKNLVFVNEEGAYDLGNRGRPLQLFSKKPSDGSYGTPGSGTGVAARPVLPGQGAQVSQGDLLPGTEIQGILPRITSNSAALAAAGAAAAAAEASRAEIEKAKKEAEEIRKKAREELEKENEERAKELEEEARRLENQQSAAPTDPAPAPDPAPTTPAPAPAPTTPPEEINMEGEFCTTNASCKDNNLFCGPRSRCMSCTGYDYNMTTEKYTTTSGDKLPNDICPTRQSVVNIKVEKRKKFKDNKEAIDNFMKTSPKGDYKKTKDKFEELKTKVTNVTGETQKDLDTLNGIKQEVDNLKTEYTDLMLGIQSKIAQNLNLKDKYNSIGTFTNPRGELETLFTEINEYTSKVDSTLNVKIQNVVEAIAAAEEERGRLEAAKKIRVDNAKAAIYDKLIQIETMLTKSNNYVSTVLCINLQTTVDAIETKIAEITTNIESYEGGQRDKFDRLKTFVDTQIDNLKTNENVTYEPQIWQNIDGTETKIFTTNLNKLKEAKKCRQTEVYVVQAKENMEEVIPQLDTLISTYPSDTVETIKAITNYSNIVNVLQTLNTYNNTYTTTTTTADEILNNNNFKNVFNNIKIQSLHQELVNKLEKAKTKYNTNFKTLLTRAKEKQPELKNSSSYIDYFFNKSGNIDKILRYKLTPTFDAYKDNTQEFNIGKLTTESDKGSDYKYYLSQGKVNRYACSDFNEILSISRAPGVTVPQMTCQKDIEEVRTKSNETAFHMKVEPNTISVGAVGDVNKGYCWWGSKLGPQCDRMYPQRGEGISYKFIEDGGYVEPTIRTKLMDEWKKNVYDKFIAKRQVAAVNVKKYPNHWWKNSAAWPNGFKRAWDISEGKSTNFVAKGREEYTYLYVDRMRQPDTRSPYWYYLEPTILDIKINSVWQTKKFYIIPSNRLNGYFNISKSNKVEGLYLNTDTSKDWNMNMNMWTRYDYQFKKIDNIWYLVGNEAKLTPSRKTSSYEVRVTAKSKPTAK